MAQGRLGVVLPHGSFNAWTLLLGRTGHAGHWEGLAARCLADASDPRPSGSPPSPEGNAWTILHRRVGFASKGNNA